MLVLLLLYLASQSWAKDVPHDTNYKFTNITICPETGYFFKTVLNHNSLEGDCYLCFCQEEGSAICWRRENKKCDVQHYKHNTTVVNNESRVKRSPLGISDIFFKDAARDFFNKKEEEVCKPYESSFSEGCPPADWCLGCTVCDCDANGHWDCHVLSFCDDEKKGKKDHKKKNKKIAISYPRPKKSTTSKVAKPTKKTPVRSIKTSPKTTSTTKPISVKERSQKKAKFEQKFNPKGKVNSNKKPSKSRSIIQKGKSVKPLIIKKNDKNRKVVKTSPSKRVMNGTEAQMSEAIMRTMKNVMQQMWNKQVTDAMPSIVNMIQKRSFPGRFDNTKAKKVSPKPNQAGRGHVYNKSLFIRKAAIEERKREKIRKKELEEKAAKAKKNNKGKKPTKYNKTYNKRSKRDLNINEDSDFVAGLIANPQNIQEQLMPAQPPEYITFNDNITTSSSFDLGSEPLTVTDNASNATTVLYSFTTTEPSFDNSSSYNNTTTETFAPRITLDESGNSTYKQLLSNEFKTAESIIPSYVIGNFTPESEKISTVLQTAYIISDFVNSTNLESSSDESITTELTDDNSTVNINVDDLVTVIDKLPHFDSGAATNSTHITPTYNLPTTIKPTVFSSSYPPITIKLPVYNTTVPVTTERPVFNSGTRPITELPIYNSSVSPTTIKPYIYNNSSSPTTIIPPVDNSSVPLTTIGSTDNLNIITDTFSWPYVNTDAVFNFTNMQSTTDKVIMNESMDYRVISIYNDLNKGSETTSLPLISVTTTESPPEQLTLRTLSFDNMEEKNSQLTNVDSVTEATSTSTQTNLDTTTDKVYSFFIESDEILNSSHTQSTSALENKLSKTLYNSSFNKNLVPILKSVLSNIKNNYYEYKDNFTNEKPETSIEKSYNSTETDVFVGEMTNEKYHKNVYVTVMPNDAENEIKGLSVKPLNYKDNKTGSQINNTEKISNQMNGTKSELFKQEQRKKISRKDIERKVDKTTKKYTITRVVNSNLYKNKRGGAMKEPDISRISLSSKIENLRNVLKRLLSEFHKNNTLPNENKKKKTNAIKYLKKFFNKIFYKDSNKTIISQRLRNNNHTIQMLCENFGPCIINKKNKAYVMKRIKELNNETIQILKSLRIIKGLLRLVDIPRGFTAMPLNEQSNFKTDIHKLNVILKSDDNNDALKKISETQKTQIDYIKSNTKVFKQSVAKFTTILNQIIDMVSVKGNKDKQLIWYSDGKKHPKRNSTKEVTIKKFKELLHNYNTIHNIFVSKIIQMFSNLEEHGNGKNSNATADFLKAEYNSENIVNNLNRLKNLASALNTEGKRQKRHAERQDNSVEYLLMLMEYMLHQNTVNSPVNDGIDLLIEAIKNAPDIQTVKKPTTDYEDNPKTAVPIMYKEDTPLEKFKDNDDAVSNKIDNSSSASQDTLERENESDLHVQKIIKENNKNEDTEKKFRVGTEDFFIDPENNDNISSEYSEKQFKPENKAFSIYSQETTNKPPEVYEKTNYEPSTGKPKNIFIVEENNIDFDSRLEKTSGEFRKNNKVQEYSPEFEDDNNIDEATNATKSTLSNEEDYTENQIDGVVKNTNTSPSVTQEKIETTTSAVNTNIYRVNDSNETIIQWRDDKDYFDNVQVNNNNTNTLDDITSTTMTSITTKHSTPVKFEVTDLSDVSKESDEKAKFKIKKGEDVLKQKEQDFMNSLDYGTEASIVDEGKDNAEEKYLTDYFAD